jgi:hypothetical protein
MQSPKSYIWSHWDFTTGRFQKQRLSRHHILNIQNEKLELMNSTIFFRIHSGSASWKPRKATRPGTVSIGGATILLYGLHDFSYETQQGQAVLGWPWLTQALGKRSSTILTRVVFEKLCFTRFLPRVNQTWLGNLEWKCLLGGSRHGCHDWKPQGSISMA